MNYLTTYYKNLCDQLQEKVNYLQGLLESHPHESGEHEHARLPSKEEREAAYRAEYGDPKKFDDERFKAGTLSKKEHGRYVKMKEAERKAAEAKKGSSHSGHGGTQH